MKKNKYVNGSKVESSHAIFLSILQKHYFFLFGIIALLLSGLLTWIFFHKVGSNQFLILHDEYISLSLQKSLDSFSTNNPKDLGISSVTFILVNLFDRISYFLYFLFGLSIHNMQIVFYFIKLFISILLPFVGFIKLSQQIRTKFDPIIIGVISFWYSFNTFTLIYWHGNAFSLTQLLCYSLAPLALAFYHKAIFTRNNFSIKLITVLLFFFMTFSLYLAAVFYIFIFLYTFLFCLFTKKHAVSYLRNILVLCIVLLPLLSVFLSSIIEIFISISKTNNLIGGETYLALHGGFLYQFLMWFSWGIYTFWKPRNIFTFDWYFQTIPSLLAPFIIYGFVVYTSMKNKKNEFIVIFLAIFLIFLFFIKGAQTPLGNIYVFLVHYFPLFRIFRSPDDKFSFGIILALSSFLLFAINEIPKKILVFSLLLVIIIQSFPLYNGVAILGENSPTSSDRIVQIPNSYKVIVEYLNTHNLPYGYVLPFPFVEFGHFNLYQNKHYIGQDILPELISSPFLSIIDGNGMFSDTNKKLENIIKTGNISDLNNFPIRYVLVRRDVEFSTDDGIDHKKILDKFNSLIKARMTERIHTNQFTLYENTHAATLVMSKNITVRIINPVIYQVHFSHFSSEQLLIFNQSYNKNWKLYLASQESDGKCLNGIKNKVFNVIECPTIMSNSILDELLYVWKSSKFESSHKKFNGYANSWKISPAIVKNNGSYTSNHDGTINFDLVIFFKTQSLFLNLALVSVTVFFIYVVILLFIIYKKLKI